LGGGAHRTHHSLSLLGGTGLRLLLLAKISARGAQLSPVRAGAGIRDHVVQSVELKFNCFFLMPIVDTFPTRLREELESAYEEDLDEVFDVGAVRSALEDRLRSLESELHQV
jgi:hypothetical protein